MRFAAFQRAVHATEPRGVVIFTGQYVDIMPHIAAQAAGINAPISVFARGEVIESAGNLDPDVIAKAEADGYIPPPVHPPPTAMEGSNNKTPTAAVATISPAQSQRFIDLVGSMLDAGGWLVVPDLTEIDLSTWREVAKILLLATPDHVNFMARRHFRLFTFVTEGMSLTTSLPPLICQFAFVVDNAGAVKTRSQLGPIFEGTTTMGGFRQLADFSKNDSEVQNNGYVQLLLSSMAGGAKSPSHGDPDDHARLPATDPQYVNEVLFRLREALLEDQAILQENARALDVETDEAFEREVIRQREKLGDDYDEARDRHEHTGRVTAVMKAEQSHDWVFGKMLGWAVSQCPDADLSTLQVIPRGDVELSDPLWSRDTEEAFIATWGGCEVLAKRPLFSLRPETSAKIQKAFEAEAARHAPLRHPFVAQLFGVVNKTDGSADFVIVEGADLTLEQALISSRFDNTRWTVRQFLDAAADVSRGMTYLASHVIHRDLSPRSVLRCSGGVFKVAQFGCALPLNYVEAEAKRGVVPVRWTAPEGFVGAFSPASDVWSFGLLLWQAVQYATAQPYKDEPYVPDAVVKHRKVPPMPPQCPPPIADLITKCLQFDPALRPSASQLSVEVQHVRRTLPAAMLESLVPFPGDDRSFAEYNAAALAK